MKGEPQSVILVLFREELEVTLKRERRMAEKSLARSKKMVCFNCRQPGETKKY